MKNSLKEYAKKKWDELRGEAEIRLNAVCDFVAKHWETIVIVTPIAITSLKKFSRYIGEKRLRERYIYDRSAGHYWYCRRKPSKRDYLELERRRKNGEKIGEILKSLGLI